MGFSSRRSFLSGLIGEGAGSQVLNPDVITASANTESLAELKPDLAKEQFMELKFGMFIHFGINTFYDLEWSDGTLRIDNFNPKYLNTDEWCEAAVSAGMKYIIFVTKHIDGFCNFHTEHTDYQVANTPYKRDILAQLAESCKKYNLKLGLYYALWDRKQPFYFDDAVHAEYVRKQVKELLTNYGDILLLWFDGSWSKQQSGWKKKNKTKVSNEEQMLAWRNEGAYRWQMDYLYAYIKTLQPNCLVMNNSTTEFKGVPLFPCDVRCGEKYTDAEQDQKVWTFLGKETYLPLQIETTMSQKGPKGQFESGSWFWHPWDDTVADVALINQWQQTAEKLQANLVLNCGPDTDGRLRNIEIETLKKLNSNQPKR